MICVTSYNIRKGVGTDWRRKPDRILSVLREIDADVIALQEVDRRFGSRLTALTPDLIEARTDYVLVRFGVREPSIGWHGNVILVRRGIEVINTARLVLPALEPRGAALADLRIDGLEIRVVGMHLGLIGLWRRRQADAVLSELKTLEERYPTVLMGDLNEWSTHGGCIAAFRRDHQIAATGPSFHSSRPVAALDRIMTSADFRIEAAGVHISDVARVASDHLPIWARLLPADSVHAGVALAGERRPGA